MEEKGSQQTLLGRFRTALLELPRPYKRTLLVVCDLLLLCFVLWLAMSLRYNRFYVPDDQAEVLLLIAAPVLTVSIFGWRGLYRLVTRFLGARGMVRIFTCVALAVLIWALLVFMFGQHGVPRTVIIGYGLAAGLAIGASRQVMGLFLRSAGISLPPSSLDIERAPVLIYGAGDVGAQLVIGLRASRDRDPVGFIDESPSMWGQYVNGVKVYRPQKIGPLIERTGAKEVLLAVPEGQRRERRRIHGELQKYPVAVKVLPSLEDIASGRVGITDVRPIDVQDLLGRDPVPPDVELLGRSITGKSILVTGAGGSIGSELVRQILKQGPSSIVLLDHSEPALYEIELEVRAILDRPDDVNPTPKVVALLGSVLDENLVVETIRTHQIDTIYHAAAYKHVPIVEENAFIGLENNTFGCGVIARAAKALGVERVVLISTDKAVRPTNVMGASKRLAELILQSFAADKGTETVFTMVRFGNVLDSSGSVVRRFRSQIQEGGPVTVTHPEVIRYFMSIPEAAELVIQAGAMASGGEVFVLDMGEPVRIDDLARLMIKLAGFEVLDEEAPGGDIRIVYSGLRRGEKLFEELLIGANTTGTEHPRILRSDEPFLPMPTLIKELEALQNAIDSRNIDAVKAVLLRTVEGYTLEEAPVSSPQTEEQVWVAPTSRTLH